MAIFGANGQVPDLIPYNKNGKFGYSNSGKQGKIQPQFEEAGFFRGSTAIIKYNGKWGCINKKGQWVVHPLYEQISFRLGGKFIVGQEGSYPNYFYTVFDQTGKQVLPRSEASIPYDFTPLGKTKKKDKCGFFNTDLKLVVDYKYDDAAEFFNGYACVIKNRMMGYIDSTGKEVIPLAYKQEMFYGFYSEGLFVASNGRPRGYIDGKQNIIIPFNFYPLYEFHKGLALAGEYSSGKMGLIDKTGKSVTGFKWDWAEPCKEDVYCVEKNKKWGFIDYNGNVLTECIFTNFTGFANGYAFAGKPEEKLWGFVDKSGKFTGLPYDYSDQMYYGYKNGEKIIAVVNRQGKWGYILPGGKEIIPCIYDEATAFRTGLAFVKKGKKYGVINEKGMLIVPYLYDKNKWSAPGFDENKMALVTKTRTDGTQVSGYIDAKGREYFE